jgi:ISXO2-like transposase domain/Transposase zinc-ribbon domain
MKNYKDFTEFVATFSTDEDCRKYLCAQKWKDGFICRKCSHKVAIKGRTWYYRKCQKCGFDESCTSNTLFHKLKFPLTKAFWIVYQLSTLKKGMSTMEIARQYGIHQETAWFFKRKIQQSMKSDGEKLLEDVVELDETAIGGHDKDAPGRSHGKKKLVQVAVEIDRQTESDNPKPFLKRAYAKLIKDYSSEELKTAIDSTVGSTAIVITDNWSSYSSAVGDRLHAPEYSDGGANFQLLHWHIFNIKNWIRGIHHKISHKHAQNYMDEFHYKFNRRNAIASCPGRVLNRIIKHDWFSYKMAKGEVTS